MVTRSMDVRDMSIGIYVQFKRVEFQSDAIARVLRPLRQLSAPLTSTTRLFAALSIKHEERI